MTLADIALDCAKFLGRVDASGTQILDLEDEIKAEIAETVRYYNREKWALTEFRGMVLTTSTGVAWYSSVDLTSGSGDQSGAGRTAVDVNTILSIDYARMDVNDLDYDLKRLRISEFEAMFEGNTPSLYPNYYTIYAGQIGLYPVPDAAYTIYINGHVKPVVPVNDPDTSVWFDQAKELIETGACKRVCLKYLRQADRAAEFAALEDVARRQLMGEHMRRSGTGKLKSQW